MIKTPCGCRKLKPPYESVPWSTECVLFSTTIPGLNRIVTFADYAKVLEEQCLVVQESWDDEAEGDQGYWKDIIHHMSDKLSSFPNRRLIWSSHKGLVYWWLSQPWFTVTSSMVTPDVGLSWLLPPDICLARTSQIISRCFIDLINPNASSKAAPKGG